MESLGLLIVVGGAILGFKHMLNEATHDVERRAEIKWRNIAKSEIEAKTREAKEDVGLRVRYPSGFFSKYADEFFELEKDGDLVHSYQIKDSDHPKELIDALRNATRYVVITSGWVTSTALSNGVLQAIRKAADRGIYVYLVYGWKGYKDTKSRSHRRGEEMLDFAQTNPNIFLSVKPTHEKVVVADGHDLMIGSFNWLSNPSGSENSERSLVVTGSVLSRIIAFDLLVDHFPDHVDKHFDNASTFSKSSEEKSKRDTEFLMRGL